MEFYCVIVTSEYYPDGRLCTLKADRCNRKSGYVTNDKGFAEEFAKSMQQQFEHVTYKVVSTTNCL